MKWKAPRPTERPEVPKATIGRPDEGLTGIVHGYGATDIEERMYRGLLANDVEDSNIEYQPSYIAGRNMPGEIRPDFAISNGMIVVLFADGEYFHKTAEQRNRDKMNDSILFKRLEGKALFPIRVAGEDLETQEIANRSIEEALTGRYESAD